MPAYLPTDKQVNQNIAESYTENLFSLGFLVSEDLCLQIPPREVLHTEKHIILSELGNHLTHILS